MISGTFSEQDLKSKLLSVIPIFAIMIGLSACNAIIVNSNGSSGGSPVAAPIANTAPIAFAQSIIVPYDTSVDLTLSGNDSDGDMLSFNLVESPTHGSLSGSAPLLTYTPSSGYVGTDSLSFSVSDGTLTHSANINLIVADKVLLLAADGDDGLAEVNDLTKPFLTAQAVVDTALTLNVNERILIIAGAGSFGDVDIGPQDFGSYVYWVGEGPTLSQIGNISGEGLRGTDAIDLGGGNSSTPDNGTAGPSITLNSDLSIQFGDITSIGGEDGIPISAYANNGGTGGNVLLSSVRARNIKSEGSLAYVVSGSGGNITISSNSIVDSVISVSGDSRIGDSVGSAGTIHIIESTVNGNVFATPLAVSVFGGNDGGEIFITGTPDRRSIVTGTIDASANPGAYSMGVGKDVTLEYADVQAILSTGDPDGQLNATNSTYTTFNGNP